MKFKPLTLGKIHWTHATRPAYGGTTRPSRTTKFEARVTCLACLKACDVEMLNQQRKADTYKAVSALPTHGE
jgi:hypothetical protein